MVRVRPYVRVSGNLSLTVSDLSANIPPFNPQKLLADDVAGEDDSAGRRRSAGRRGVVRHLRLRPRPPSRSKVTPAVCELSSSAAEGQAVDAVAAR